MHETDKRGVLERVHVWLGEMVTGLASRDGWVDPGYGDWEPAQQVFVQRIIWSN